MGDNDYYRPYDEKDEEEDIIEDEEAEDEDEEEDDVYDLMTSPDFRKFAAILKSIAAAGPSFPSSKKQLSYGKNRIGRRTTFSSYDDAFTESDEIKKLDGYGKTKASTQEVANNPVLIDSKKRDRRLYAQPVFFTTRLPRIYRNITGLQFSQVEFLNRFYYFRPSKNNVSITIQEQDREPFTIYIRQGSYTITELKNEIELQLNGTPIFYDYPSASNFYDYETAYNTFYGKFALSKDYSLNFNYPGDNFYNNGTNTFITNPTMNQIVTSFWSGTSSTTLGTNVSTDQIFMAYYYPVLKEIVQDEDYTGTQVNLQSGIGIDPTITTVEQVKVRIVNTFQGLTPVDPVVYAVCIANKSALDQYRLAHTFRYSLVNRYSVSISPQDSRITISSSSLNKSLINLINAQFSQYTSNFLSNSGLTYTQYVDIKANSQKLDSILTEMYDTVQTNFASIFAIPYNTYTKGYYSIIENTVKLRDGRNAIGIPQNPVEAIGIIPTDVNILDPLRVNPKIQWPRISDLSSNTVYMDTLSNAERGDLNHPYNIASATVNETFKVVNTSSSYILSDFTTKSVNCILPINAGQYSIFKFHSPVRQTLQVETLSRPYQYRYPTYTQQTLPSSIMNKYIQKEYTYDVSSAYIKTDPVYEYVYDNLYNIYLQDLIGWTTADVSARWMTSYAASKAFYAQAVPLEATLINGTNSPWLGLFYRFVTPDVSGGDPTKIYRYKLNITAELYTSIFGTTLAPPSNNFRMFVYEDRAGFQGDLYFSTTTVTNFRNEDPLNYKYSTVITPADTSGTIVMDVYPGRTYYLSFRSDEYAFGTVYTRIFPWFSADADSTKIAMNTDISGLDPLIDRVDLSSVYLTNYNYAKAYDAASLALPIQSTLWGTNPTLESASFDVALSPTTIGYDLCGVSTDYLDYVPYRKYISTFTFDPTSNTNLGFDPMNRFMFQSNSSYDPVNQTYLYPGSSNNIYTPNAIANYTPTTVEKRQDKIVHYYSPTYISEAPYSEILTGYPVHELVATNDSQKPYTSSSTNGPITGYEYDVSGHLNINFGVLGFSFAPADGIWNVNSIQFRSAIADYDNDPNKLIKYLGVFKMSDVYNKTYDSFNVSTAIALLSNSSRITYDPRINNYDIYNDPKNAGFDTKGGSYYEFKLDSNYVPVIRGTSIQGYTQVPGQITNNPNNLYSVIALDASYNLMTIKGMSGSVVPYPFHNTIGTSIDYKGTGVEAPLADPIQHMTYPSSIIENLSESEWNFLNLADISAGLYGPPPGYEDGTESVYLQSMPVGTSVLHSSRQNDRYTDPSGLNVWSVPFYPTGFHIRNGGYAMIQESDFYIYTYSQSTSNHQFGASNLECILTESDIYDFYSGVSLVGATSNNNGFVFIGFATSGSNTTISIKKFNPVTQELTDYTLSPPIVINDPSPSFNTFTMSDSDEIVLSVQLSTADQSTLYWYKPGVSVETTSSSLGVKWLHDRDTTEDRFYVLEVNSSTGSGSTLKKFVGTLTDISNYALVPYAANPTTFSGLAVNYALGFEDTTYVPDAIILKTSESTYSRKMYQVKDQYVSGGTTYYLVYPYANVFSDLYGDLTIESVHGGYQGAYWATTNRLPLALWGNRNNKYDLNYRIDSHWQIFYPYQKINLTKVGTSINPMLNTEGLEPGEYLHTNMFYYENEASLLADISGKWGLESSSNFSVADVAFRGYYFNSYIFDIPLQASQGSDYQYIAVRGYSPTESGETLVRFNLPNFYDFGYATFLDISNEILIYNTPGSNVLFNTSYGSALMQFDSNFQLTDRFWGYNPRANFAGSNYQINNFASFISTYSYLYKYYISTTKIVNEIDAGVSSTLKGFIATDLKYILPESATTRQNFTDPLPFRILWNSSLPDTFKTLKDNWSLGFNLGFEKADTPYATYHISATGYKIIDDFIYLQMNEEDNMNRLDTCEEEDHSKTTYTTGETNRYFGKLLLNGYNQKCYTFVQNPIKFTPPLARLDRLTFTWVDQTGTLLDNSECEWTAVATITEKRTVQLPVENS